MTELPFETCAPNAYEWTDKAYDLLLTGQLHVESVAAGQGRVIVARGRCPRCGHDVDFETETAAAVPAPAGVLAHDVRAIRAEGGAQVMPDPYESLDIACHCRGVHPGRPEGVRGCGIIFRVEIERRALS